MSSSSSNADDRLPALSPPPDVTSNFVNPYSLRPTFVIVMVLCLLFATVAVLVRLAIAYCRPTGRIRVEECTFSYLTFQNHLLTKHLLMELGTCVVSWVCKCEIFIQNSMG